MESDCKYRASRGEEVFVKQWMDEEQKEYKGVIQIVHGMQEHIGRYQEFAKFLADNGYIVIGHDHLGHGNTAKTEQELGHFADERGWDRLMEDIHTVQTTVQKQYPDLPYIMFGHSMGSLLVRRYIMKYQDPITAVVLSGTSGQKYGFTPAKIIIKTMMFWKGKQYRSKFVKKLITGSYNKEFELTKTESDWLTRDTEMVEQYEEDPKCGGIFTLQAYYDLVRGTEFVSKKHNIKHTRDVPILLFSGDKDPVGQMSKGVIRVYQMLKEAGIQKVRLKLFKDGRHEMLNEINKDEVYDFVLDWVDDIIK